MLVDFDFSRLKIMKQKKKKLQAKVVFLTPNVVAPMKDSNFLYYCSWVLPLIRPLVSKSFNAKCFHADTPVALVQDEVRQSRRNSMSTMSDLGYHMTGTTAREVVDLSPVSKSGLLVVVG